MKAKKLKVVGIFLTLSILTLFILMGALYIQVSRESSGRISRGAIDRIIFSESPVYYDDGQTPIGVFFEQTHRKYIDYADIPKIFIKALIAAEDRNFFNHPGFDLKAIMRALLANIEAGRVVQGGSTLTQQTAKNIFKRQKRSYMAKLKELIQALLLEREYTKEEILELYTNQFFVTGFGRGLAIAAQYYFDKNPEDLDLTEAAFIAGSVKGPYRYNPFNKKTEAEKKEAERMAKLRKDYVLSKMRLLDFINRDDYLEAKDRSVPFKEGKVTYRLNVVLDYVRDQLESDYFRNILQEQGVENIATSGIRIHTSVNSEIQAAALGSIRERLPLLDVKVSGYNREALQEKYRVLAGESLKRPKGNTPFFGRITQINADRDKPYLMIAWENGGGIIDYDGLKTMGEAWRKGKVGNWATFDRSHLPDFLRNFRKGDLVTVQFMETTDDDRPTDLMLTKIPELEGGIVVLSRGVIKAMVGGYFNRFFNRAVDAKRQLGSIFKPLVYSGALQLKWNSLDTLMNARELYRFEKTYYVPRPDHDPKSDQVSMTWAGVKSENLATVWLLYHLTDRLSAGEFREVVKVLGLDRGDDESYREYVERIRDEHGVVVNREALMEAAFEESKKEIEADLIFGGHEGFLAGLRTLHYRIDAEALDPADKDALKIRRRDFQRLQGLNAEMKRKLKRIKQLSRLYEANQETRLATILSRYLRDFYVSGNPASGRKVIYTESPPQSDLSGIRSMTPASAPEVLMDISPEEITLDGLISSRAVDLLHSHLTGNYKELLLHKKYDPEVLFKVRDFKTLVNLLYLTALAKEMGIDTRLDPVLSFPLGANSISIIEAALAYQAIMTGKVYRLSERRASTMVPLITKILDRENEVIWSYRPKPEQVLSNRVAGAVSEILRLVMDHGTGRKAKDAVTIRMQVESERLRIPVPSFGKTGTANRHTNSSFVGFIPGPEEGTNQLSVLEGYVIASYVGFDDNQPMKGENVAIYGASGALPLWVDTANGTVNSGGYKGDLQIADLAFDFEPVPLLNRKEALSLPVSPTTGLPLTDEEAGDPRPYPRVLSHAEKTADAPTLKREFEPLQGVYHDESFWN